MTSAAAPRTLAAVMLVLAVACATPTPPPAGPPRYPDFVYPTVPEELAGNDAVERHGRAWRFLQAGNLRQAEHDFGDAVRARPGFYPAEAGLGYLELAQQNYEQAIARFERALSLASRYVPALVGRGEALLAASHDEAALQSFEAALAIDASLTTVHSRVEVLRFRRVQADVARARRAFDTGQYDEARAAYARALEASPQSAFLYRELATVEERQGRLDQALDHAGRAADLDPSDARTQGVLGDIHLARGEFDDALEAYERAGALEPSELWREKIDAARAHAALARLPAEYRDIFSAPVITRAQLAALLAVRLEPLVEWGRGPDPVIITDTREHWAASWIIAIARARLMEVYPNYTFQPGAVVDRGELAEVVSRALSLIAARRPDLAAHWRDPQQTFSDLAPGHLLYPAAALAVSAGVLPVLEGRAFQLTRPVTGAEATDAVTRLDALLKP